MAALIANPPLQDSIVELDERNPQRREPFIISKSFAIWLEQSLLPRVQSPAQVLKVIPLTAQAAAIALTPVPLSAIPAGLYRVSWYFRITQAATVNSSLTVTIGWTETAIALTKSGAAEAGNTTATTQSGSFLIRSDANAPINYSTTYVSVGATPMQYRLDVVVELVY